MLRTLLCGAVMGAAMVLGLAAAPQAAQAANERFVLISHAPDSDSWWNTIKTAIREAGQQVGATVDYHNPSTGDLADMARILRAGHRVEARPASSSPSPISTCSRARSRMP